MTDAPPDDQDARRRARRWWAALILAACYGLSGYFITGDPGKGFVVTLFLIVLFVLLFVFFPRLVYQPVWLPVDALAGCRASGLDTLYTSVALAGARTRIEVLDPREQVLAWCRRRGLTEG